MGWLSRHALVIAVVLVLVAAGSSMGAARQSGGTPAAGTPIGGTPAGATPLGATPVAGPAGVGGPSLQQPPGLVDLLAAPTPGTVSIVASYPITTGSDGIGVTMVLVRNATDQPVANISVAGSVRDTSGALTAVGANETTWPAVVQPGQVAHAYLKFQGAVAYGTSGQYAVTWGPVPPYSSDVSLEIQEANKLGDGIIGFVRNPSPDVAYQGILAGSCYDAAGQMTNWLYGPLANTRLAGNSVVPFNIAFNTPGCTSFILTAGA